MRYGILSIICIWCHVDTRTFCLAGSMNCLREGCWLVASPVRVRACVSLPMDEAALKAGRRGGGERRADTAPSLFSLPSLPLLPLADRSRFSSAGGDWAESVESIDGGVRSRSASRGGPPGEEPPLGPLKEVACHDDRVVYIFPDCGPFAGAAAGKQNARFIGKAPLG